jgi:hypothetical protein
MRLDMDIVRIRSMLRSPTGPVGRRIIERGKAIEARAKQLAAKHGTMANGIVSFVTPTLLGTEVIVMSTHPASIFVLKGTKAHDIHYAKPQALNFKKVGWRTVSVVHIPAYKGDDFMLRAMEEAGGL